MDRDSHGPRGVTPFGRVLDDKNDFSHTCILSEESCQHLVGASQSPPIRSPYNYESSRIR
jgi:hypothetical protein